MGLQFKSKSYATVWLIRASTSHTAHPKGWQLLPGNAFLIPYRVFVPCLPKLDEAFTLEKVLLEGFLFILLSLSLYQTDFKELTHFQSRLF